MQADYLTFFAHSICRRQSLLCPEGKSRSTQSEFTVNTHEWTSGWTSVLTRRAALCLSVLTVKWQCGLTTPRGRPLLQGCRPATEKVQLYLTFCRPLPKTNYFNTTLETLGVCLCVIHLYSHPSDHFLELEFQTLSNHSVSISWRQYESARPQADIVVEWFPEGYKSEELRWVRLGKHENSVVLTGGRKFQACFKSGTFFTNILKQKAPWFSR